jgi:hypothetical protein
MRAVPIPAILISAAALALLPGLSRAENEAVEKAPLVLSVGEQRLLRTPGLSRFSLGGSVARSHPLGKSLGGEDARDSLLIRGEAPGPGDLWIWKSDGSSEHRAIQVERGQLLELSAPLARALSRLEECEIIPSGPDVLIRGRIETMREAARVSAILHAYPKEVVDGTSLAEPLLKKGREELEAALRELQLETHARVERVGSTLWVRGGLERKSDRAGVERRLKAAFPPVECELDALPDSAPTVHFKVFLLELKKNRSGAFGLTWPALQEGAFRVTTSGVQDMLQLDLTLQALETEGSVRVLSNPELVVRPPGEAQLFAGGELPISLKSHYYESVTWKNYGLTLKLKVTDTTSERVRLEIFTEVSRLDPTIAMDNVPGLQTNRMNTSVDARYGKPLFLSGLLQEGTRESARGLPLLRRLPILGALFGSEDYLNERSELVAVLLPGLDPPSAPMHRFESTEAASRPTPADTPPAGDPATPSRPVERFPWHQGIR